MSVKSFWNIVVKIFGLILILRFISEAFQGLISAYQVAQYTSLNFRADFHGAYTSQGFNLSSAAETLIYYIVILGCYFYVIRLCLFKTSWVIEKLDLAKNPEEEKLELNIHRSVALKIAIIIAGAFFIADGLPLLFLQLLSYYQHAEVYTKFTSSNEAKYIVMDLTKVFVGYFMLTCSRMIVNFIELKRKDKTSDAINDIEE